MDLLTVLSAAITVLLVDAVDDDDADVADVADVDVVLASTLDEPEYSSSIDSFSEGVNIVQRRFFILLGVAGTISSDSVVVIDLVGVLNVIELRRVKRLCSEPFTKIS